MKISKEIQKRYTQYMFVFNKTAKIGFSREILRLEKQSYK